MTKLPLLTIAVLSLLAPRAQAQTAVDTATGGPKLSSLSVIPSAQVTTADTGARPKAIEYSDAYYTRLTIHRYASYAELPLFAAEYALGQRILNGQETGDFASSSTVSAH